MFNSEAPQKQHWLLLYYNVTRQVSMNKRMNENVRNYKQREIGV